MDNNNTSSIQTNAKTVNKYINTNVGKKPEELYKAARHLIINGGKRLRPHMTIKSCQMLGGTKDDAMPAAGAVEMIHNFTLIHDDIMDNDDIRHGVQTVHKKFGTPVAILAGDVLYSKAYQTIADSKIGPQETSLLVSRLAKACVDVCEGQFLDMKMSTEDRIPTQKEYITMIRKKTSALFDVSCTMGAVCAKGNKQDIANLSAFGRNLGIAFQITDDLIGVMGDPSITKKPVGNDLREGKKSLPILMAINAATDDKSNAITNVFANPNATSKDLKIAVQTIRELGIEKDVRGIATKYAKKAKASLAGYSGIEQDELVTLLDFVVKRRT